MREKQEQIPLLRDTRGAVMAEGVIVLPIFVLTLAAIFHFHSLYAAKLDLSVKSRACAWNYSIHGCRAEFIPKGCKVDKVEGFKAMTSELDSGPFDASGSTTDKALAGANRVGLAIMGLREGIAATHTREINRPSILGGGKRSVSANYTVMCNERDLTPLELAKAAYCSLGTRFKPPGC